jgi:hypothetical protein
VHPAAAPTAPWSRRPKAPPAAALLLPGFWLSVPGSLGLIGITRLVNANDSAAIAETVVSMISIALGLQTGLLLWRGGRQPASDSSTRRAEATGRSLCEQDYGCERGAKDGESKYGDGGLHARTGPVGL